MKLYAVIGTITPGCGVYIHLYGLHTDRKAAERRRAEVEAAARRANEGEIEDVAPRLVKVVEADGEQRRRMLDHWGDPDYMYDLVSEVEDSGHALSYDLFRCEDWDE